MASPTIVDKDCDDDSDKNGDDNDNSDYKEDWWR
jgi:hypothetical protein